MDKEYRHTLCLKTHLRQEWSWISGCTEEFGLGLRRYLSVSLPLLKRSHLASDGFHRLRFKGPNVLSSALLFFLSFPTPAPAFFPPLFRTPSTALQNPHLEVLSVCKAFSI